MFHFMVAFMPVRLVRCLSLTVLLLLSGVVISFSQNRLNLPRMSFNTELSSAVSPAIRTFFESANADSLSSLPDSIQQMLIAALPTDIKKGCPEMIGSWGTIAENTAHLSVWQIHSLGDPKDSTHLSILVFRCESGAPEYHLKYGDEFPVALRIRKSSCTLESFPGIKDCDGCSDLTVLKLDRTCTIGGHPAFAIDYTSSSDNPCCGGPESFEENKVVIYLFDGTLMKEAGSFVRHRIDYSEDDTNVEQPDQETISDATVVYNEDNHGNLVGYGIDIITTINGKAEPGVHTEYHWDDTAQKFVAQ